MFVVYLLSFQGEERRADLPAERRVSRTGSHELVDPDARSGDIAGAFQRSIGAWRDRGRCVTVVLSVAAGLGFRRRFFGSAVIFYIAIASLIMPGLFVGLGINVLFSELGLGDRLDHLGPRRAADLDAAVRPADHVRGARPLQPRLRGGRATTSARRHGSGCKRSRRCRSCCPGIIGVALFGFTLSYDEFPRTVLTSGTENTLPIEIWTMTTNVTSPALYALGTVTTLVSFAVIGTALGSIALIQRRRRVSRGDPN